MNVNHAHGFAHRCANRGDPIQVCNGSSNLLIDGVSELCISAKKTKEQEDGHAMETERCQQNEQLPMELEWLQKHQQFRWA
jgi:hypothetical protein